MTITSHELARKLLDGPDIPVRFQDGESAYSSYVEGVDENPGRFCECDDFPEDPDDEESEENIPWSPCRILQVDSTDGILEGDSIIAP